MYNSFWSDLSWLCIDLTILGLQLVIWSWAQLLTFLRYIKEKKPTDVAFEIESVLSNVNRQLKSFDCIHQNPSLLLFMWIRAIIYCNLSEVRFGKGESRGSKDVCSLMSMGSCDWALQLVLLIWSGLVYRKAFMFFFKHWHLLIYLLIYFTEFVWITSKDFLC